MKNHDTVPIDQVTVSAYTIPTDAPEADGTLEWNSTTMIVARLTAGGKKAIGYTYAHISAAYVITGLLKDLVTGADAMQIPMLNALMIRAIRNNGDCGIAMMAVSAVDIALWDLKAKLLNMPVCSLVGKAKDDIQVYGSGGFTSYTDAQLVNQFDRWAQAGITCFKMKVGADDAKDPNRIKTARSAIGPNNHLFIDANGAYAPKEAIAKAHDFAEYNVSWFEEPVPSYDLDGLNYIRNHAPDKMAIAAGEYGYNLPYFENMLQAKAVDILQADATRCGGITGFLKAGYLCEAHHIPLSSHCAPAVHLHAALSTPSFYIAEYFHDHAKIEEMFFDGNPKVISGRLRPDSGVPGLGLVLKEADAEQFRVL